MSEEKGINYAEALEVVRNITYKPEWEFEFEERDGKPEPGECDCPRWGATCAFDCASRTVSSKSYWLLRLHCPVEDAYDAGQMRMAYGRWWVVPYKTRGDIVRTAFMACLTMEEHEARETFKYKGVPVLGPHIDVEEMVEIALKREHQPEFETQDLGAKDCCLRPGGGHEFYCRDKGLGWAGPMTEVRKNAAVTYEDSIPGSHGR